MKDVTLNVAFLGKFFFKTILRAVVHLGKDLREFKKFEESSLEKKAGQLFKETEIADQL